MAYVITKPCVGVKDTACVAVCPCDCIHPNQSDVDFAEAEMLYIDPAMCVDCDMCVEECPVKAIFPQDDVPEEFKEFIEKNAVYYRDPSQALAC